MKATVTQQPPLAKGLACQRCSARKVRCTGGKPACAACLRTAKFKNHPLDQVCCAYGAGLCTEHTPEKGPGGHGGRGRKKDPITGEILPSQPKPQSERRGLGQRTSTADSTSTSSSLPSAISSSVPTSSEPTFAFDYSVGTSPAFTPATSVGSISPSTASKQLENSIQIALALPVPPPRTQPVLPHKAKIPLAARRLGAGPMKIDMPGSSFAGASNSNGKRPAQEEPLSATRARFGSIAERRQSGQLAREMVIPIVKRSRSGSPAESQTESIHEPALSASGSISTGSSDAVHGKSIAYGDSPLVGQSQSNDKAPFPTPDPYPSSYNGNYQYTDAFSSYPTPYLSLMTGGGRLTGGAGAGTPFWYGEKRRIGATEIDFGEDSQSKPPPNTTEIANVGGTEVTW